MVDTDWEQEKQQLDFEIENPRQLAERLGWVK